MINEQTQTLGNDRNSRDAKTEKRNAILSKLGIGIFSAGAGAGAAMFLTSATTPNDPHNHAGKHYEKPETASHPAEATKVNDSMDFKHAFDAARHEVGSNGFFVWHGKVFGTLYAEEQGKMSVTEQKTMYTHIMEQYKTNHHVEHSEVRTEHKDTAAHADPHTAAAHQGAPHVVIIHDEAPHATTITNDMSFKDAFALARAQVGPGGIFDWHGHHYNTYTREELNSMEPEQKHEFMASVGKFEINNMNASDHHNTISEHDIDIVGIDHQGIGTEHAHPDTAIHTGDNMDTTYDDHRETVITDKLVHLEDGSTARVVLTETDGHPMIKIDMENDGNFDMDISKNADGTYHLQTGSDSMDVSEEKFNDMFHIDHTVHTGSEPGTEGPDHDIAGHSVDYSSHPDNFDHA